MWESELKNKMAKHQQELLLKKLQLSDLSEENHKLSLKYKNSVETGSDHDKNTKFEIQHSEIEVASLKKTIEEYNKEIIFEKSKNSKLIADQQKFINLKKDLKENYDRLKVSLEVAQTSIKEKARMQDNQKSYYKKK